MRKVTKEIESTLEGKIKLLKELNQEDLLNLFTEREKKRVAAAEKIAKPRVPLDQQISFGISAEEKEWIAKELYQIRRVGPGISISSFVRNQVSADIDIEEWAGKALKALRLVTSKEYDPKYCREQQRIYMKLYDDAEDTEDEFFYRKELDRISEQIKKLTRKTGYKRFRLSGRITYKESQIIRWRAHRLNLTVSDYVRYLVFGYSPGEDVDLALSLDNRKRFYISVLDVQKNGWKQPPAIDDCQNCQRYLREIRALREQIKRYQSFVD